MAVKAEESALLTGLVEGDAVAGTAFSDRYRPRLLWLAHSAGVPSQEAEDVVQEALTASISQIQRGLFRGECSLGRWLETILRGKVIDYMRSTGKMVLAGDADGDQINYPQNVGPVAPWHTQDLVLTVREILDQMPPRQRTVLILHKMFGLTIEEVAARLRWRPGSVGRIVSEAKATFYEIFTRRAKKTPRPHDRV
jgi:RNA polymerase sigma factor (sigma-70 family)